MAGNPQAREAPRSLPSSVRFSSPPAAWRLPLCHMCMPSCLPPSSGHISQGVGLGARAKPQAKPCQSAVAVASLEHNKQQHDRCGAMKGGSRQED